MPRGIGWGVPYDTPEDKARFGPKRSEVMDNLYDHLRTCRDYKVALFGLEIGERLSDIDDDEYCLVGEIPFRRDLARDRGIDRPLHAFVDDSTRRSCQSTFARTA